VASISVIIPAYNRANLIGETLKSLLNQTVTATEIIVVDDGSQDETAEKTLEAFENWKLETGNWKNDDGEQVSGNSTSNIQHPTLKILRRANAGPGAARNRGFAESTGEFIHFFDSDDIAAPNKQEVQLRALLETGADIAYGPWVKGRFLPAEKLKHGKAETLEMLYPRRSTLDAGPGNFVPEGPVLQARGLPEGDLVRALLTNWSIVPHACLFRRSILEKAEGFPEDIWVGEDQLLFLRCLLAGAKVVHTPGTMVFYRVGNDPGKLTATGAAQKRHARDWARFLLKANEEVKEKAEMLKAEKLKKEGTTKDTNQHETGKIIDGKIIRTTEDTECTEDWFAQKQVCAWTSQAGASGSGSLASKLADSPVSESPARCASGPASDEALDSGRSTLDSAPSWYGFRLRAYEAWRDLEKFFPTEENELKENLERMFLQKRKFRKTETLKYQAAGFLLRKLGGLKLRVLGYRENTSFRCGKFSVLGGERCVAVNQKN